MNLLQNFNSKNQNIDMSTMIKQMMQNNSTKEESPEIKLNQMEVDQ